MAEHGIHLEERDVVANLRARVGELERDLRSCRDRDVPDEVARFRSSLYEAVLYGLGRTLSLYDPPSVSLLV
ncbi:MAG TPA: hypothetical protein VM925_34840, partial [Labilithrix sp.]|nr:hypothetical protein [Labilithrix sp.]